MVRSLNLHKQRAFISDLYYNYTIKTRIIQPLNPTKDTQGYYPYKKQFYIYKGI